MLTFNLKKEWFEKIQRGEKTVEYREVKPYWTSRLENSIKTSPAASAFGKFIFEEIQTLEKYCKANPNFLRSISGFRIPCVFALGYSQEKIYATINKIEMVNGKNSDLHIDALVYAIHFKLNI